MTDEELRGLVAQNITLFRKQSGQTQAELAEKLNYSDKSISKWERAEGVPDIYVLSRIADMYGITVNDLLSAEPPCPAAKPRHLLITLLSLGLVWLVATVAFFALTLLCPNLSRLWMCFIYALPVCAIVLIVFTSLWWHIWQQCLSVSLLVWFMALSIHLTAPQPSIHLIYIVGGVLQVLTVLWFLLRARR